MPLMLRNSDDGYGLVSKILHWAIAFGAIGLIGLGWWMVDLDYYDSWYNRAPALHRAFGMIVLLQAVLLVIWKIVTPSPSFQSALRRWETLTARVVHGVLICSVLVVPASGYLISTSAGAGFSIFGLIQVPAVAPISDAPRDLAIALHAIIAYGLVAVIAVHAGAALKHQFIDKHGTLKRML